ncbi:sigma-70 family RNA polymerase sigma factor [Ramlibacter tataouinensis]|uniref:sigma-70 family RNA polymerase sigma factor n=1 Tax=Ramlibacter tataouinensis TaxID=94132 RepID=UPI0022F3F5BB|nr:sigma-70 family RNA polymerase sigma factor [Ramlibacter tataouinensis]WBY02047.1 sigma-70 family RNA polymerase sigma factor [Ramlibacter tataouinensis]
MQAGELEAQIPQLRRYARALTGDAWAADDLVQDTLERACDRWQLWKAGSDLRAWLFTLMHNLFIDGARRALRQAGQRVDIDDVAPELAVPAAATDQVLDLQRCLLRLPEEQREVLLLVALQDLSYEEVARVTGTPIGTVMSRLSRARSRLRELMEGAAAPASPAVLPFKRPK